MNSNRYNLRSSGQQQVAPSFYPTSSTTGGTTTGAGTTTTTTTTTSTTGLSSSSLFSRQPTFQTGQSQQFQAQPGQFSGHQQQQQQHLFADAQAQAQAQQNMENMIPTHYQQGGQGQVQPGQMTLGGPAATAPFLQDFTLVAEAVKRVQMDAVMTEMESITL
ncbi:hypothetical protein DPV78_002632 [Talaromyces pinophilus]|nr:hypothetical protein DPV78_002632 [Talaromyces pinophilus]